MGKHSKFAPQTSIRSASALGDRKVRNDGMQFDEAAAERYLDRTHDVFASRITGIMDSLLAKKASRKVD